MDDASQSTVLADPLAVEPVAKAFEMSLRPPGSKSLTNRALLLALLSEGSSMLRGALTEADDAQRMLTALGQLGAEVKAKKDGALLIRGTGGRLRGGCDLMLNNAGTATRFLTAAACLADGPVVIDGNPRMRERPIGELIGLLRGLGVEIDEFGEAGFVPIRVHPGRMEGGVVEVPTTLSSQYISALLMVSPMTERGLTIRLVGDITSPSYLRMTLGLMERVGLGSAIASAADLREIRVGSSAIPGFELAIEPDASGATYLWAAAAIVPGASVSVAGLDGRSLQGDAQFVELLGRMGATVEYEDGGTRVIGPGRLEGITADLSNMPDAAMTLAAVACYAEGVTELRGLRTLRVKETDRVSATKAELEKIGAVVELFAHETLEGGEDEGMRIIPPSSSSLASGSAVTFETYDDHRMAMSLSLIGLRRAGVSIADPGCVGKTYPGYWSDLAKLRGSA